MSQIRRGLRIGDNDQQQKPVYQKQSLDANRRRTNFQKDMDDLLFGGGPKPVRRPQPPKQQTKPVVQQVSKPIVKQQQKPVIKQQLKKPPMPKVSIKKIQSITPPPENPKTLQKHVVYKPPVPVKTQPIKINNFVKEQITKVLQQEPVSQPKQHEQPKIAKQQNVQINGVIYNRPVYIRKLKKIAQDFNFAVQNSTKHIAFDVVRPFQCQKARMKKLNDVDFIDNQFPPTSYSLGFNLKNMKTEWKRHNQTVKSSVFGKYIDPNDINPGKLSSLQFLSTLSVLSQMQINIKRLIQDQKVNNNGFYLIRLNINGVWRYVPVDDKLPYSQGQALGCQSFNDNQSQMWPSLIQKAYAKSYGGYNVFQRSTPRQNYLRDLTGAPVKKYLVTDKDFISIVKNAISVGHILMAVPKKQIQSLGLNPNHSFAIINCKSNGGFQLRNSWGTLEQRPKIAFSKQGIFELSPVQANQFLSYVIIAETNNQYSSSIIQSKHKTGFYSTYSFFIKESTHGYLTVCQLDERFFPAQAYEYSPIRLILQKKGIDDSAIYLSAGFSISRNLDIEVNLKQGEYQIFISGHWKSREYDYYLSFFGQQKIDFKRINTSMFPNKITQSLTKINLQTGKRSALGHCNQYIQHHKESNLIIVTADNTSDKDYLYNQDFTKVNFSTLSLLNSKNNQQLYAGMNQAQILEYKNNANQNRKWPVSIGPKEHFTWVISCSEQFNPDNFKKYGFR